MSAARTADEVAELALDASIAALGGAHGFVLLGDARSGPPLVRTRGAGVDRDRLAAALGREGPAGDCFGGGAPVFVEDRAGLLARCPRLAAIDGTVGEALAALPLEVEGRSLGVLGVAFAAPRRFDEADRALAVALAGQCALALERARLAEALRRAEADGATARERLAFLDDLSKLLVESADEREMLGGLARLSVPVLGAWAGVFVPDGPRLEVAARGGAEALGGEVELRIRDDPRLAAAGRCAAPVVVDDLPARAAGAAAPSALLVPLCLQRRSIGAFVVARDGDAPRPSEADLALAADAAHRTALAVEHVRLLREATVAAAAREEFLHVASHELRGPLGTLRLSVELLTRDARHGNRAALDARLRVLRRQTQRLVRLSDSLLDVSRITAGRIELVREDGDLAVVVRDVAAELAEEAAEAECALSVHAHRPVRLAFDAGRMEQVVTNLLSNALKYGRGCPVRVAVRQEEGRALVEVEDHGIGIAPEDQQRIFGRFARAVSGREYAGLGLGLWIARHIVEAHGGTLRLESALGRGSTFTVELPAGPGDLG